jgi:hypothetical protein
MKVRERPSERKSDNVDSFAARISAAWQQAAVSIIETGRLLIQAKAALRHGEFGNMIDTSCRSAGARRNG